MPSPRVYRILILDDDEADRLLTRSALEESGLPHIAREARTIAEARHILARAPIDCALLDQHLSDGLGSSLAREFDVPCVLVSGMEPRELERVGIRQGAHEFLPKDGADAESLEAAIIRAVERHKLGQENARERRALEFAATIDPLTRVLNRRGVEPALREGLADAARSGLVMSALLLDCDDFKNINAQHGHSGGDEALRRVARAARKSVRPRDSVARVGGDEFLVLLPGTSPEAARAVAERIRGRLRDEPSDVMVTVSIGVAPVSEGAVDVSALVSEVQAALAVSKEGGKDRVAIADPRAVRSSVDEACELGLATWARPLRILENGEAGGVWLQSDPGSRAEDVTNLRTVAAWEGRLAELDRACVRRNLRDWAGVLPNESPFVQAMPAPGLAQAVSPIRRPGLTVVLPAVACSSRAAIEFTRELRAKGARLAIDGVGGGHCGIGPVCEITPEFIVLAPRVLNAARRGEGWPQAMLSAFQHLMCRPIASGLDTPELVDLARSLGVTAGMGDALGPLEQLPTA